MIEDLDFQCSNGMWIKVEVEYEWVPLRCTTCGVFGHTLSSCPKQVLMQEETKQWVPKNTVYSNDEVLASAREVKKGDGDWVTISRKKKGKIVAESDPIVPLERVSTDVTRETHQGECSSKGMKSISIQEETDREGVKVLDEAPLVTKEEGECTPIVSSFTKEDEEDKGPTDSDSSLSTTNQLAVKAKDSLEKKTKGRNGKHKKGSAKKGRARQSPKGGSWR